MARNEAAIERTSFMKTKRFTHCRIEHGRVSYSDWR